MHDNFMIDGVDDPLCRICPRSHKHYRFLALKEHKKSNQAVWCERSNSKKNKAASRVKAILFIALPQYSLGCARGISQFCVSRAHSHTYISAPTEAFFSKTQHTLTCFGTQRRTNILFGAVALYLYLCAWRR
jgi:hypothetical protein